MKDRLSIHIDNGQASVFEAVTVLRNGGTTAQSGLVGITNATYNANTGSPIIPETIFNVQSTGDLNVRFSSGPSKFYRSSIELLGNGNARASGLHITYNPSLDDAFVSGPGYGGNICVNPNAVDNAVVDFSLIRASGTNGAEFSHITMSERGYIAIGLTRVNNSRRVTPNAPLTISYSCDGHQDSGTISMREQAASPTTHADFGKIYVKPYTIGGRTQALYFKDDGGNETNLILSEDLEPTDSLDGLIYGDNFGNTYGGWYTPAVRFGDNDTSQNTYYGYGAGHTLGSNPGVANCNTLIGYLTGSGLKASNNNTVIGCSNLKKNINDSASISANRTVILGDSNLSNVQGNFNSINDVILIGRNLYNSDLPNNGDLAIGFGTNPLIEGNLISNRYLTIKDGFFSVLNGNSTEFKIDTTFDVQFNRNTQNINIIDYNKGGAVHGEDNLKFNFSNANNLTNTLFQLDPRGGLLTNSPSYQVPSPIRPFAQLDGDFRLRGAIRFQDGTSLSGLSQFELTPIAATSGINKIFQPSNNTNYLVLNYSTLNLAGNLSNNIRTDNTFVAVQVDGSNSSKVGKISLQGLVDYISSGTSTVAENCNIIISNPENELKINAAGNARSVMIGCDVAFGCSGQYNSIMIGSYAGANSTVSNPTLTTPFNNIFIGPSAGEGCNNTSYAVCLGTSAGKNSDNAQECIFIGSSAGLDSTLTNSIGIGKNALRGGTSASEGGNGNIEIVAGLNDSERFFYDPVNLTLSNRLAINKTIAGRMDRRNISIGDARLSPTAPLEARYSDNVGHSSNPTLGGKKVIQSWYCNDTLVAYINCDGNLINSTNSVDILFVEGITNAVLTKPSSINNPTTAVLSVYVNGVSTGSTVVITNRDVNLGPVASNTYVIAIKIGSEYRPIWVSC